MKKLFWFQIMVKGSKDLLRRAYIAVENSEPRNGFIENTNDPDKFTDGIEWSYCGEYMEEALEIFSRVTTALVKEGIYFKINGGLTEGV